MGLPDQIQTLICAFVFGLLSQATIAALLLYVNGHGSTIFKDHRRLVLVFFLTSTVLWAQVDFINFAVPPTSPNACQVTIIASTFFDQAARIMISGFLLWSVGHVKKTPVENSGLCALMGIRIVIGVIFIAYARPQFAPVCIARSDLLAASIAVVVLDMIIIGLLIIRAFTLGLLEVVREVRSSTKQEQSKALLYCTAGLFLWTSASSAMMVGMPSIALLLRTALPATGLMVLVLILTSYTGALVLPRDDDSTTPEARSPFVAPPTHSLRSLSDDDGSPILETGYTRTANLFVVNPSNTPHDSSVMTYLEDVKAEDAKYIEYGSTGTRTGQTEGVGSSNVDVTSNRASSGVFQSLSAATLEAIGSAAFLAAPRKAPVPSSTTSIDQVRALPTSGISSTEARQNRARFGWSRKSAEKSVHKIAISNPVMDVVDPLSAQPFARMRTVDLATAAASERERREGANNARLVAKRPAPPPPKASEVWRNSSSIRRKEIPRSISVPPTSSTAEKVSNESRLSVTVNASSTSASLSPGREDVRRRSPRSIKTLEGDIEKAYLLASRPTTIIVPKGENQQTVMFVNDIIYSQPGVVNSIIKDAPTALKKSKLERGRKPVSSPKSSTMQPDSIMHRPRPYRRDLEKDHVLFANESSPRHTRSKSSPSTGTVKTVSQLHPRLTALAARPQMPTTAAGLKKLLPNDTRSMTIDEKISLLFPAPPGVHHVHNRRSSVPSLPRIPSSILLGDSFTKMLTDQELQERRASKRTTISFGSQIQKDSRTPLAETPIINEHGIYRFSANTYRTLAGSPRDYQVPELPGGAPYIDQSDSDELQSQTSNSQRDSATTISSSEAEGSHDDSKSAWASIHSPVPAIDVITAQRTARETYIRMRRDACAKNDGVTSRTINAWSPKGKYERNAIGNGEGLMTVTFGIGDIAPPPANMRSFLINPSPVMPDNDFLPLGNDAWHSRIGDKLPAFSQRRKYLRSRTMPPPTPLLLGSNRRQPKVIARKHLVDEEDDSPETALKEIQAQLSRFDGTSRLSLGSLMHRVPEDSQKSSTTIGNDRLGLLANLEKEMGQQETLWMRMQHNFDRDSNSTIMTPQVAECTPRALPSPPSETSSRNSPPSVDGKPRIWNKGSEPTSSLTHSPDDSRAKTWQQRLAEAEIESKKNAPAMLHARNVNFFNMSKVQLGSPTPPDSVDSESDPETEMDYDTDENIDDEEFTKPTPAIETNRKALWKPELLAPSVTVGHLWSATCDVLMARTTPSEPVAKELRPVRRRDHPGLQIESSKLWSRPSLHVNRASVGLWNSRTTRLRTTIYRPKAQRPQRKSKRVTFLPDILENPSPLPHKRDTLGIFQFPWGEKSGSAVYDPIPVPNRASLSSFALNSFESEQAQVDTESSEYSSSFFDDYEDDYEGESEVNSDDDFDESTLWEIATLLNSQDVPSRKSLLPYPRIIEDYDDSDDSEQDVTETISDPNQSRVASSAWPAMAKFLPIKPLKPLPPLPTMQEGDDFEQTHPLAESNIQHMAAPIWQAYLPALDDAVRGEHCKALSHGNDSRPNAEARILWDKAIGAVSSLPIEKAVALWTKQSNGATKNLSPISGHESFNENYQTKLWTACETKIVHQVVGLFEASIQREDYRTSHQVPAVRTTFRKPRVHIIPLATLSTQQLWSPDKKSLSDRQWISMSSVRALSPSLCSAFSSGISSPGSNEASAASAFTNILSSPSGAGNISEDIKWRGSNTLQEARQEAGSVPVDAVDDAPSTELVRAAIECDPAVRHPVFFVSMMSSDAAFIHPAATGYIMKTARSSAGAEKTSQLWVPSSHVGSQALKGALSWTEPMSARNNPSLSAQPVKETAARKRTKELRPLIVPGVSSTSSSRPTTWTPASPQNWIQDTALRTVRASSTMRGQSPLSMLSANTLLEKSPAPFPSEAVLESLAFPIVCRSTTWTAPKHSNTTSKRQDYGLWAPFENSQAPEKSFVKQDASPKYLASYKHSRRGEVGKIESAELWRPKWGLSESPKDWLRSRKATKVDFRW